MRKKLVPSCEVDAVNHASSSHQTMETAQRSLIFPSRSRSLLQAGLASCCSSRLTAATSGYLSAIESFHCEMRPTLGSSSLVWHFLAVADEARARFAYFSSERRL